LKRRGNEGLEKRSGKNVNFWEESYRGLVFLIIQRELIAFYNEIGITKCSPKAYHR